VNTIPDPTVAEMIGDHADLRAKIDALLAKFHRQNAGLRLEPTLRKSWGDLRLGIRVRFSESAGTCDMGNARLAVGQLQDAILGLLKPFALKYPQASLALDFNYVQDVAQSRVNMHF
jgi:hypothetical protein